MKEMCKNDWNIVHRKWSKKMLSLGVPTLKKSRGTWGPTGKGQWKA
jgi:hypothetical protein